MKKKKKIKEEEIIFFCEIVLNFVWISTPTAQHKFTYEKAMEMGEVNEGGSARMADLLCKHTPNLILIEGNATWIRNYFMKILHLIIILCFVELLRSCLQFCYVYNLCIKTQQEQTFVEKENCNSDLDIDR